MSEPRKLYTAGATGSSEQEQYEAARRRAQQLAEQNARRRTVQQPMRTAPGAAHQPAPGGPARAGTDPGTHTGAGAAACPASRAPA